MTCIPQLLPLLGLTLLVGCDSATSSGDDGGEPPTGLLAECAAGDWEMPFNSGRCSCDEPFRTRECDSSDCESVEILVLDPAGEYWPTGLYRSASRGTFTVTETCPPPPTVIGRTWEPDDRRAEIVIVDAFGDRTSFPARCSPGRLVTHDWEHEWRPADPEMMEGLRAAFEAGECSGAWQP